MYIWRNMTESERRETLNNRVLRGGSWRRPPVWKREDSSRYLITAACYEHREHIGYSLARMDMFQKRLLTVLSDNACEVFAYVILPNHYHVLVQCPDVVLLRKELGALHGSCSYQWNKEEQASGRKVFHGSAETIQKSDRHFHASMNYVHHNPVRHGYVKFWQEWPWSSACEYLATVGKAEARRIWLTYPIKRYGQHWD